MSTAIDTIPMEFAIPASLVLTATYLIMVRRDVIRKRRAARIARREQEQQQAR